MYVGAAIVGAIATAGLGGDDDDDLFFDERAIELLVKLYQSNDIIQQNESLAQMWRENLEKKQGIREKEIPGYRKQKA